MSAAYREISYKVPIAEPIVNQAWVAERGGNWRLVVFPGTPARKYLFERMLNTAPDDLETVVIARPGFGRGHDRAYLDFNDQVAAARPFFDGDKNVIAMGVSYGGELALKSLVDFPDKVKGAVTVAALVTEPRGWVHPFVALGGAPLVRSLVPKTLHFSREEISGRRAQIKPLFASLKNVRAPITILHGDVDHLVSPKDAELLQSYFADGADVEFQHIRGGTHFLEMQYPRLMFAAVKGVIERAERKKDLSS